MSDPERAARIEAVGYDYGARTLEPVSVCNLCGSGSAEHLAVAHVDRYGYPATLLMCSRCGLAFLSPRLTAEEYGEFYGHVYRPLVSAYHGRRIDAETVQVDQRDYAAELVEFLRDTLPLPPRTVLDVGGSTGVVAGAVQAAFGATATVLDPAPGELEVAAAAGMETFAGVAEEFDPGRRRWDLVLLCQTIDHLLDIRSVLGSMRQMTADDGHAFVDVLDFGEAARRHGVTGASKIDHPYYLTRETALAFFALAGYEPVAERFTEDGHAGWVLEATTPREPDRQRLEAAAAAQLATLEERT
ncbi:MAG TPA: methyltransferase domain-containing protein [Gaiellaceae bacterium]|jgi:ubiquinone/menaquinone biosynthesis C-methylase UbiE